MAVWKGVVRAVVAVVVGPADDNVGSVCGAKGVRAGSGLKAVEKGEELVP